MCDGHRATSRACSIVDLHRWLARRGSTDRPALRAFHDAITSAGMLPTTLAEKTSPAGERGTLRKDW
jgi:hypothetical protein